MLPERVTSTRSISFVLGLQLIKHKKAFSERKPRRKGKFMMLLITKKSQS